MWDVVRRLVADGSTVLLTTQYLEEADALADEITVFDHGRVIAHDTPEGLKRTIGGQRIRVRPTDRERLDDVRRILAEISGRDPQPTGRDELTAVVDTGEEALATTVGRLAADSIGVTELSLHLPSLDEVFLTLTGHRVGTDTPDNQKEAA
jgi:oleandomycin transport system ATP-binding protein